MADEKRPVIKPPTQQEIWDAIDVLARTQRYSVRDNEQEDWIA